MKHVYHITCDFCGNPFSVTMHAAEFKRCMGKSCCGREQCRDAAAEEFRTKILPTLQAKHKQEINS